jgi:hypothetical protein
MTMTDQFQGFEDHVTAYLGEVERVDPGESEDGDRGYDLLFCHHEELDMVSVVTSGLRYYELEGELPEELVCSVRSEQAELARYVVDTVAQMVLGEGTALDYGQLIPSAEPLLADVEIQGVITLAHPYAEDGFDLLANDEDEVELQLISLVPVTKAEADEIEANGVEAVDVRWQEDDTDLLDLSRPSAI